MSEETKGRWGDAELMRLVNRLVELKAEVGRKEGRELSDGEFARRFLPYSSTVWSKVQSGTYTGSAEAVAEKSRLAIEQIEAQLPAIEESARYAGSFVRTQIAKAALAAVNRARGGVEDRRVVVVLAPTGFGKSSIAKYMATRGAVCVEGRQTWRTSYKSFCADVCRALGRKVAPTMQEHRVEAEMVQALSSRSGVLYIDEANTLSAAAANAIKYIVNRTGYVVVIAAIPQMWDRFLEGNRDEVLQLVNRCQPIIRAKTIPEADAAQFLERRVPGAGREWVRKLAAAGNAFGGFRTVEAIANRLAQTPGATEEDLDAEIRAVHEQIAASGIGR